ncbi:hypothetical protein WJX84_004087 [Apatococcus fuscideae]|uniref:Uncharacterized protein n=1 Tax=Apatococcus fuscideae TaxID=2026836 RepID=A0AAW1SVI3_9CHLO
MYQRYPGYTLGSLQASRGATSDHLYQSAAAVSLEAACGCLSRIFFRAADSEGRSAVREACRRRRRSLCRLSNVKEEPHALAALVIILHDTRHLQETTVQTGQETGIDQKTAG